MKKFLTLLFSIFLYYYNKAQNEAFVSTTGSDATGNESIAKTFTTAAAAVNSGLLPPGSNLYFREGTCQNPDYQNGDTWKVEGTVSINNIDRTPSSYIIVKPYNNKKISIRSDCDMIYQIRSSSHLRISGFEIVEELENITYSDALYHQFELKRTSLVNPIELRVLQYTNTDQSGLKNLSSYTIYRPTLYNCNALIVQNSDHGEVLNNVVHHVLGEGMRFSGSDCLKFIYNEIHDYTRRSSLGVHGISDYGQRSIDNNDGVKTIIAQNLVHDKCQEIFSWPEYKTNLTATIDERKHIIIIGDTINHH